MTYGIGTTDMYFDLRLWGYTKGVRGRIFGAVAVGINNAPHPTAAPPATIQRPAGAEF